MQKIPPCRHVKWLHAGQGGFCFQVKSSVRQPRALAMRPSRAVPGSSSYISQRYTSSWVAPRASASWARLSPAFSRRRVIFFSRSSRKARFFPRPPAWAGRCSSAGSRGLPPARRGRPPPNQSYTRRGAGSPARRRRSPPPRGRRRIPSPLPPPRHTGKYGWKFVPPLPSTSFLLPRAGFIPPQTGAC